MSLCCGGILGAGKVCYCTSRVGQFNQSSRAGENTSGRFDHSKSWFSQPGSGHITKRPSAQSNFNSSFRLMIAACMIVGQWLHAGHAVCRPCCMQTMLHADHACMQLSYLPSLRMFAESHMQFSFTQGFSDQAFDFKKVYNEF